MNKGFFEDLKTYHDKVNSLLGIITEYSIRKSKVFKRRVEVTFILNSPFFLILLLFSKN
jgi:hypothetical protein